MFWICGLEAKSSYLALITSLVIASEAKQSVQLTANALKTVFLATRSLQYEAVYNYSTVAR